MIFAAHRGHDDHEKLRLSASESGPRFFFRRDLQDPQDDVPENLEILFIRPKTESGRQCALPARSYRLYTSLASAHRA
jgi:hypothetical protein